MRFGFTGTRRGMTDAQRKSVFSHILQLSALREVVKLHHGQCLGSDEEVLLYAKDIGGIWTVAHPSNLKVWTSQVDSDETREPKPTLIRNRDIVDECDLLIACPGEMAEVIRSGTWATIRYAREVGRRTKICWPNGEWT